jgi:predicted N-acetyltransferase YhbS
LYSISAEISGDWWEVEALFDLCFAPGREALSSYRLREDVPPVADLCLIARDADGILAGAVRFWPVTVGRDAALLLGPIAVHPTRQGEGLAQGLITDALTRAVDAGWHRVLLVGDAPYYGQFGFSKAEGVMFPPPTNPDRVLACALTDGAWDGVAGLVSKAAGAPH